jgi:flagellar P-ring protein precursor FlgI
LTVEGYFAGGSGGSSARKNFQTAGQIPGGATVERGVESDFSQSRVVQLDLNDPDPAVATRAAAAIGAYYKEAQVAVTDPVP